MTNHSRSETAVLPRFDQFKNMVENAALVESLLGFRNSALIQAREDAAWIPHLEFVKRFMRECGIKF